MLTISQNNGFLGVRGRQTARALGSPIAGKAAKKWEPHRKNSTDARF